MMSDFESTLPLLLFLENDDVGSSKCVGKKEVLSRVSVIPLKRLHTTRKDWNTLFKNLRFREKQFLKAAKKPIVLMLQGHEFFTKCRSEYFSSVYKV